MQQQSAGQRLDQCSRRAERGNAPARIANIGQCDKHAVPAGGALAVDRDGFSSAVTTSLHEHPLVDVRAEEVTEIPQDGIVVIATGPLTSPALSQQIKDLMGEEYFYFYDAAAPIVEKDSIDMSKVYLASRYDKGEAAYLNCPMTEEEFEAFYEALITAEKAELKDFEKEIYFEGCMPVEVIASVASRHCCSGR